MKFQFSCFRFGHSDSVIRVKCTQNALCGKTQIVEVSGEKRSMCVSVDNSCLMEMISQITFAMLTEFLKKEVDGGGRGRGGGQQGMRRGAEGE